MICPKCSRWELTERDLYCAWCGTKLADFELALVPPRVWVGEIPDPVELRIRNTGLCGPIEVRSVSVSRDWLQPLVPKQTAPIPHDRSQTRMLEARVEQLDGYHECVVRVETNIGVKQIPFGAVPYPEIEVQIGDQTTAAREFEILLDERQTEKNACSMRINCGVVTIEQLTADVPWAAIRLPAGVGLPHVLDARDNPVLEFEIAIDEHALLDKTNTFPASYTGNVIIRYGELDRTQNAPFRIKCYRPPELHVPEEESPRMDALAGRPARLSLSLWNGNPMDPDRGAGRAVLRVAQIEVREPDGKLCDWVRLPEPLSQLEIPGGEFRQISLSIHTTEAVPTRPGTSGIGTHRVDIVILTNEVPDPIRRLFFEVVVRKVPRFQGVVAIDYGTTNTCVAVLHPTGEEELIPIEDGDTTSAERTAPSAIQYLDLLENRAKKYEIGTRPAAQMHMREAAESIVTSAKRHLGSTRRFPVVFRENKRIREEYPAREIVADYLQKVRERAEEWLGKRIVRCVITHPSRFALCQIRDLNAAAIACFGEGCRLEHLHEPVAAALGAIVTKELCERPRYSILVYDFGGGTTDITLLEVENRRANGCLKTIPRLLGADGHPRVGGDDATEILAQMGLQRCQTILTATHPDLTNFLIPTDPKPFTQPWRRRMAEENRMALQAWAEMSKILLSLKGDAHRVSTDREWLTLHVFHGEAEMDHRFPHSEIVPPIKEFEAAVEEWLIGAQPVLQAKKLAEQKGVNVDIVLLAGKSSLLAPVQRLIRHHFPNAEIRQPKDMKQCVVQGACMFEKYREAGSAHQICLDETIGISATTSRIGRKDNEFGKWIFAEIVAAGEPVPEAGLRRPVELRGGLNRRCRVTLLENVGLADELPNPDIKELGFYEIENVPPEITDQQLRSARVELLINRDLDLTLRAIMPAGAGPQAGQKVFDFINVKKQDQLAAQA